LDGLGELAWDDFTIGQIVKKAKEKNSTHFSIRKMTDADIKRYELSSKREEIPWNLPHEKLIALGPDNQFAGFAVRNRKSNRLDGLWVQPEFRRQGLGKTLIRSFKKEPSRLNVLKNNSAAQDLYQQLGYSKKFNWRDPEDPAEHWTKVKSAAERMTGIRYETSQGEGIYEALRKKDPEAHRAMLKSEVYKWLRKPDGYPEGGKSFFTARGEHAYRNKTLRFHQEALKDKIRRKVEKIDPKDIVYRDEHQFIIKKASDYDDLLEGIKTRALRAQMAQALQHYEGAKDPSHGIQHIREVVQGARDIMPESGVDPEQVLTAAILHDIAREAEDTSGIGHEISGPAMAKDYLGSFGPAEQKNILHAIRQHRTYGHPRTLLAKVVRDADKLYAKKPEILLRRLVDYRRAHGMPEEQIAEDARQRLVGHIDKETGRLPSLLTPKAIEMAAPWRAQMTEIKNDPVKWNEAIQPYLGIKEAASNLYRNRVEAFALTPDGKVIAGLYPGKAKNVAVPGGGIELGETKLKAAKREFKEEAGIAIKNVRPINVAPVLTAWARKDKSYKGRDWRADIKKHPKGNRTHFVLADVDTAKSKTTPRDPTEFHKTLKARPIEDLIEIQRKAIRTHKNSDRLKQMRKRLEVLLKIKHSEKQAFEIKPNDLMRFMDVLDDKYWMYLLDKHRKEKATLAAQSTYLPPDSTEDKGWDPATLSNRRT
jgi:8-oxo-dGTP pyrophosphatase MutT (NUDIX family)/GNAT superfamily N-acetyltransferase